MPDTPETVEEFAKRVKSHHAVYANVPDEELTRRVLQHYPQYRDNVALTHKLTDPATMIPQVAKKFGMTITSGQRSAEHNAAVGGAPHSRHIAGEAYDIVGPRMKEFKDYMMNTYGGEFHEFLDEGDHLHLSWDKGGAKTATPVATKTATPAATKKDAFATARISADSNSQGEGFWKSAAHAVGIPASGPELKAFAKSMAHTVNSLGKGQFGLQPEIAEALQGQPTGEMVTDIIGQQRNDIKDAYQAWVEAGKPGPGEIVELHMGGSDIGRKIIRAAIPMFGRPITKSAEQFREGNVRGGLGSAAGVVAAVAGPKAVKSVVGGLRGVPIEAVEGAEPVAEGGVRMRAAADETAEIGHQARVNETEGHVNTGQDIPLPIRDVPRIPVPAARSYAALNTLTRSKAFMRLTPSEQASHLPPGYEKLEYPPDTVNPAMPPPGATGAIAEQVKPPGMSRKNVLASEFRSQDRVLSSYDSTRPMAQLLTGAQDRAAAWTSDTLRRAAEPLHGLRRGERFNVGKILDTYDDPAAADPRLYSASSIGAAVRVKQVLNDVWKQANIQAPLGRISSYWTHIERAVGSDPDLLAGIKQSIEHHMSGRSMRTWFSDWFEKEKLDGVAGGDIRDTITTPDSPFRKHRTGGTSPIEYDPRRVLPAYIESMAKVIHDRPVVAEARAMIADMPKSRLREYAEAAVRNYANFSVYPEFTATWDRFGGWIGRQTGRSMVGFFPGIQTLHLARVPLLLTELGAGDWAAGVAKVARHPIANFQQVARMGLLPNFVEPWDMMKGGTKLDAVANFFGVADYLDRAIAYRGFTRKLLREGMSPEQAHWQAIAEAKKMSFFVDRTRAVKAFTHEGMTGSAARLGLQFKHQPIKMVEYYASIAAELKRSPMKAVRLAAISAGLIGAAQASGIRLWHLGPSLLRLEAASAGAAAKIVDKLAKGDVEGAMGLAAEWGIPGGYEAERLLEGKPMGGETPKKTATPKLTPRKPRGESLGRLQ
jgi:hypothetical protein